MSFSPNYGLNDFRDHPQHKILLGLKNLGKEELLSEIALEFCVCIMFFIYIIMISTEYEVFLLILLNSVMDCH